MFAIFVVALFALAIWLSAKARRAKRAESAAPTLRPMSCLTCRGLTFEPHTHISGLTGREVTPWTDHVGNPLHLVRQ